MYPHIITNNGIIGTPPVGMAAGVLNVLVTEEVVEFDVTVRFYLESPRKM
jgi:hypothetical protein